MSDGLDDDGLCAAAVEAHDHDRWLAALFAPDARRAGLMALYAFNLEVARVRETVREPMLGEIRLQWWRETLQSCAEGRPREQPVARALARNVNDAAVWLRLQAVVDARSADLDAGPPADLAAYAAGTAGNLTQAAAILLGHGDSATLKAAWNAGTAYALVGLVRAAPFLAAHGRPWIAEGQGAGLLDQAVAHLAAARASRLPRGALAALLPATIAGLYLPWLRRAGGGMADPDPFVSPLRKQVTLIWRAALGQF